MKFVLAVALALRAHSQAPATQPSPEPDVAPEVHLKAVKLVETSGARDRLVASIPDMIIQGKTAMQKQCPGCDPAFFTEWAKRMTDRLKVDDFVNVAVRAYEKRFTNDELNEFLAVVNSQKTDKPVPLSSALQKKVVDLLPAIMGEIAGGTTQIGAKLGGEIGAEIQKEHPEYFPQKPKSDKP